MALIDDVQRICQRLAPAGWGNLLQRHGLNITAPDLKQALAQPLSSIDRSLPGFEDFSSEGNRGIEPGSPAKSLLYHALASPLVILDGAGAEIREFPTLADLEVIENYVFGIEPPSIADLINQRGTNIAIAIFAVEYRPAAATVHRKHAALCFSRTGVTLQSQIYNVEFFLRGSQTAHPRDLTKVQVAIRDRISVFVGVLPQVLVKGNGQQWQVVATD